MTFLLAVRESSSPLLLTLSRFHATRDYPHPSPVPFSAQVVNALGLRDSSAADRRSGYEEPVSSGRHSG